MEVCNIVDPSGKVSWAYKNSHFETIEGNKKSNYYPANSAGSIRLDLGITTISKDPRAKVIVFRLDPGGRTTIDMYCVSFFTAKS